MNHLGLDGRRAYIRRVTWPVLPLSAGLLLALLVCQAAGVQLDGSGATALAVAAIGLFGLPHGALDIERVAAGGRNRLQLVARYLAVAGVMAACWAVLPVLGLGVFLLISVYHFSRDWAEVLARAERIGLAGAIIAFTAVLHAPAVAGIFTSLAGPDGALAARALRVAAGPAAILAGVALVTLARTGHTSRAIGAAAALAGTLLLPPVAGFALFFCAVHSPPHLAEAHDALPPRVRAHGWTIVAAVTLLALGGGALLYAGLPIPSPPERLVTTAFLLLSVLTAPHLLLRRIGGVRP